MRIAGVRDHARPLARRQLRLAGALIPAARETVEKLDEFEEDFVADRSAYVARFGDHTTPLDDTLRAAIGWYRGRR